MGTVTIDFDSQAKVDAYIADMNRLGIKVHGVVVEDSVFWVTTDMEDSVF
jgi:hypothetical protein